MTSDSQQIEYDTVAGWTESVVRELGPEYAVVAGCRGSAHPAALRWLADRLALGPSSAMLDSGGGIGGPAGWLAQEYELRCTVSDPMHSAVRAARRLYGLPAIAGSSTHLPFREATFDRVWCLGVVSAVADKQALMHEQRRVLTDHGMLGLLVYARQVDELPEEPDDTHFASWPEVQTYLARAGFDLVEVAEAASLLDSPPDWDAKADAVEQALAGRHSNDERWQHAQEQSSIIARLLERELLKVTLAIAYAR